MFPTFPGQLITRLEANMRRMTPFRVWFTGFIEGALVILITLALFGWWIFKPLP